MEQDTQGDNKRKPLPLKGIAPYFAIPILCIVLFLLKRERLGGITLLLREALVVFGFITAIGDIREQRVPNSLIGVMLGAWALIMIPQLFYRTDSAIPLLFDCGIGFLIGGGLFLIVYFISRKGLGGGDVKFMAVSGLYLGSYIVLAAMFYGSVLAAIVGLTLLVSHKIGKKDTMPLVPFLYAGMLLAMFLQ